MTINKVDTTTNEVLESYQNVISYTEYMVRLQAGKGIAVLYAGENEKFMKEVIEDDRQN